MIRSNLKNSSMILCKVQEDIMAKTGTKVKMGRSVAGSYVTALYATGRELHSKARGVEA